MPSILIRPSMLEREMYNAERCASGAPGSGSGADAGGRQVQALVGHWTWHGPAPHKDPFRRPPPRPPADELFGAKSARIHSASRPEGIILPASMSLCTRSWFRMDLVPFVRRGVKRCKYDCSSPERRVLSLQPKQSPSSSSS